MHGQIGLLYTKYDSMYANTPLLDYTYVYNIACMTLFFFNFFFCINLFLFCFWKQAPTKHICVALPCFVIQIQSNANKKKKKTFNSWYVKLNCFTQNMNACLPQYLDNTNSYISNTKHCPTIKVFNIFFSPFFCSKNCVLHTKHKKWQNVRFYLKERIRRTFDQSIHQTFVKTQQHFIFLNQHILFSILFFF